MKTKTRKQSKRANVNVGSRCVQRVVGRLIDCVPTNWVDSILTGPDAVIAKQGPWGCRDIENICNAIRARMIQELKPPNDQAET